MIARPEGRAYSVSAYDVRACGLVVLAVLLAACQVHAQPKVVPKGPSRTPAHTPSAIVQLQRDIEARIAAAPLDQGTWGVVVHSLASGETLYARNSRKLLMPASAMKTLTLAVAAERLGWDFSFETRLVADGAIDERFLNGDLIVVGQGDPSLDDWDGAATRLFTTWAQAIKARGIDTIGGRIIGNDNAIDDTFLGAGWAWDDLDRSFATGIGALQFNQNTVQVTIGPGAAEGAPAVVALVPAGSGLVLRSLITTSAASVPASVQTRRLAGSAVLELRGSVPLGSGPFKHNASVNNSTLYFVNALRDALIANGINVRGLAMDIDDVVDAPTGDAGVTLVSYRSPPLSILASTMMKLSQNLYAETLMQAIGGLEQARSVLEGWGIAPQSVLIADGSGLSRYNLVTPEALVAILAHVAGDARLRGPFEAALPLAGRDGTLEHRMRDTAAQGNVRAKTGSFSNARSLSGYVRSAEGEPLAFAVIANNYGIPPAAIEHTIDSIAVLLAAFRR